jgi:acyl phosphate:glycerol-3-phosphate acyltransferase
MSPILILVGSYLAGSLPFGFILARVVKGIDIRQQGSGNIGATNVTRVVGTKWGAVCFVLDALKGALPVWLLPPLTLAANDPTRTHWTIAAGLMTILGHMFPCWLRFRGGKGVATALGVVVILAPLSTAITFGVFAVCFGVSRIVSLSSIVSAGAFAVSQMIVLQPQPFRTDAWSLATFSLAVPTLIIARHRTNIVRLLRGEEHRFEFGEKKSTLDEN